jgi:hypothetical protein
MRPTTVDRLPRRTTDRIEDLVAWALFACALLLGAAGVFVGLSAYGGTLERARVEAADRVAVVAVLTEDAPSVHAANPTTDGMPAAAAWRDAAGNVHTGIVEAGAGTRAGASVPVWVDRSGVVVAAPVSAGDAVVVGVGAGVIAVVVGLAVLVGIWFGVRRVTAACNAREWERDWARVAPAWGRGEDAR